ncbi:MAG: IS1634 family transposase [Actinobacteria bacterium]|nr:IS1634 family transposase [Actinomycetota bacterium]
MFIKITKSGSYKYAQAVESYRENGQVKHRVLFNLGRLDVIKNNPSFQNFARKLLELSNAETPESLDIISEAEMSNWGYAAYKKIWNDFGLDRILNIIGSKTKISYSLSQTSFLMAISHLLCPSSKLATYNNQQRYVKLSPVGLNDIYRSLDILADAKEEIEKEIFEINKNLFNLSVDIVFYDVTTFSFSSVISDSLKGFGYSKEAKPGKVQVVTGLLIDSYGRPIGYEIFPGNTFDGKTLPSALECLEKRFGIRKVIIVADKGIASKINLKQIIDKGYSYIFAYRIKSAPDKIKDEVFKGNYMDIDDDNGGFRYKAVSNTDAFYSGSKKVSLSQKVIITYSSQRAKKDKIDRDRAVEKAKALLEDISRIKASNKKGAKKYIAQEGGNINYTLDTDTIYNDSKFDGYYAIVTNEDSITEPDVISAYHNLYKIEHSFRLMKSNLEVQPIFVWTPKRIKGHFVICFLAFLLERHLEYKLYKNSIPASTDRIRGALNSLNFAKVTLNGNSYFIKTKAEDLAYKILRILKIPSPKNITPEDELNL